MLRCMANSGMLQPVSKQVQRDARHWTVPVQFNTQRYDKEML
jgi:hypothetical protein